MPRIPGPIEPGWYETLVCDLQWHLVAPISVYDAHRQPRNTGKAEIAYYNLTPKDWREVKRLPRALFVRYPLNKGVVPDDLARAIEKHYGWWLSGATYADASHNPWAVSAIAARNNGVKTAWLREWRLVWR